VIEPRGVALRTATPEPRRPGIDAAARRGRSHYFPEVADADWNDWRWQFRNRVTTLEQLHRHLRHLPVASAEWERRRTVLRDFRMGIPPYYLALIDADDPDDPILRQAVPLDEEYEYRDVGDEDPLGEEKFSPVPGITHRYPDRVLMVISNSCAVYCRYCTRKRIMYEDAVPDLQIDQMVDYIARTPGARRRGVERRSAHLLDGQARLDPVGCVPSQFEIIRIGTRILFAAAAVDDELCEMLRAPPALGQRPLQPPGECTRGAAAACDRSRAGIPLNNQAVLLKG
jgi:lysine 2,3-aminomutase